MKRFNYKEIEKITSTPITKELFDTKEYINVPIVCNGMGDPILDTNTLWDKIIDCCELLRKKYCETKERKYFDEMIRLLPNSYNLVNLRPTTKYVRRAVKKWSDKTHYYAEYNKEHHDKYKPRVKEYYQEYKKEYYSRPDVKERMRQNKREYYAKHKEELLERQRNSRKKNPEKYKEYARKYYLEHKDHILERNKERNKNTITKDKYTNKEYSREYSRKYYQEHKEEILRKKKEKRAK